LAAKKLGVKLLQFWDTELHERKAICKSIILANLGLCARYYARSLNIECLTGTAGHKFFAENHLQGPAGATITYGLFDGDVCVAAMSFGKPRFNRDYEWEIVRFANLLETVVVGGASRLWAHFVKTHRPKSVLSYADLRISQGQLYKTLGFKTLHVSEPNYFWSRAGGVTLSRYSTQRKDMPKVLGKQFKASDSVKVNMERAGWHRVWDAGNLVMVNADPDGKGSQV
jgi:hypothetical protein